MYSIDELAAETGATRTTIYYYRKKRVLSPPLRRGNAHVRDVWGDIHIRELRQALRVREQNRTLAEIAELLHPEEED